MAPPTDWNRDHALMQRVARGDREAQQQLVERLANRFYRIVGSILRGRDEVDDFAQGALLEVLRSARNFRGESSIETWADRVAVRHTMHVLRSREDAHAVWDATDPDELPQPDPTPASWEELPGGLQRYLDGLSEPQRTTLVLRHALGYSLPEIAELTGVSVRRVKKRLLRAKTLFRKMARRDQVVGVRMKRGET